MDVTRIDKAAVISFLFAFVVGYAAVRSSMLRAAIEYAWMSAAKPNDRHTPGDTVTYLTARRKEQT